MKRPFVRWLLLPALVVGGLAAAQSGLADELTTVEPNETANGFAWNPSSTTIGPGRSVAIRNPSNVVPHGVAWTGGPGKPSCTGVPIDDSGTDWSGTCTFSQPGSYTFVCTVHSEMRGSVTVSGETAPVPPSGPGQPSGGPSDSDAVRVLRLAASQHGHLVRGSLDLLPAAVGGKLSFELRARRASLGSGSSGTLRVGRLLRSPLRAGRQSFAVPLTTAARRALLERGSLPVVVKLAVAPPSAAVQTLTRRVVLHA